MTEGITKGGKVMVAMSGGVDSSVAAHLLQEAGYEVVGANLCLFNLDEDSAGKLDEGIAINQDSGAAGRDAEAVCRHLGIPYHRFDLREAFREGIMDYFCEEYLHARTPNPCCRCNKMIKFGRLRALADEMGFEYLATGHYARVEEDSRFEGWVLKKGTDPGKDQSYALFALHREDLARILLPMGGLHKGRTRELARTAGLPVSENPESQDICFIPDGDYSRFISARYPDRNRPGPVVNRSGEVLGTHQGLFRYTVGQRRGIGVAAKKPYYVLELRPADNALVVGHEDETYGEAFEVSDMNWLVFPAEEPFQAHVKIRYTSRAYPCEVSPAAGNKAAVCFQEPQKAITPGQAAVFYCDDVVLGGGWIV